MTLRTALWLLSLRVAVLREACKRLPMPPTAEADPSNPKRLNIAFYLQVLSFDL